MFSRIMICSLVAGLVATLGVMAPARANLVRDGSFEVNTNAALGNGQNSELGSHNYAGSTWGDADVTTYWDKNTRIWYVTDGSDNEFPDGSFAYRIDARLDIGGAEKLWQSGINLDGGKNYLFSFWMWGEAGNAILDATLTGPGAVTLFDNTMTSGTDGVAELKSALFVPPADGAYTLNFFTDVNNGNNHAWVDAVSIEEAPEPLTLAALSLAAGGIVGYLRRRRPTMR